MRKEFEALEQVIGKEYAQKNAKLTQQRDEAVSKLQQLNADIEPLWPFVELFKQHPVDERRFAVRGKELNEKLWWIATRWYPVMAQNLKNGTSKRLPVHQLMQDLMEYMTDRTASLCELNMMIQRGEIKVKDE